MNIIGKRYLFFLISGIIIIPGLIALILWGLKPAIDFTGGSMLEVQFETGKGPKPEQVIGIYKGFVENSEVQVVSSTEGDQLTIRSIQIDNATKDKIVAAMGEKFSSKVTVSRFDSVGPTIGNETSLYAGLAVAAASLGILFWIWFAFRGIPHAYRYGTAAIIAMLHDVAVMIGVSAMFSKAFGWEIDALFLTALLTVIGFSVHDTIVVFDRIRENQTIYRNLDYTTVVNHSILQTLDRSINSSLTVMITLAALALLGGVTLRHFVLILLIGVFSGTYSSIFNAAPILVVWENREWKNWFKRKDKMTVNVN
jgi:preprotein translocase subunit SecF